MPLIIDDTRQVFDIESVGRGDLIRAQYHVWDEPRNGIIATVSEDELTVLFLPGRGNVSSYFTIWAGDVAADKWAIRWTRDLAIIHEEGDQP